MKTLCMLATAIALAFAAQAQTDSALESEVQRVSLFKNGLALVEEVVELPGPGKWRLEKTPMPMFGSFWIDSEMPVVVRSEMQPIPEAELHWPPMETLLLNKQVTLALQTGETPQSVQGTVRNIQPVGGGRDQETLLMAIEEESGNVLIVPMTEIRGISMEKEAVERVETQGRIPAVVLELPQDAEGGQVRLNYLAQGLTWMPSYRLELLDEERLRLTQKTTIRNELRELVDAEIELISGYPNLLYDHVISLVSPQSGIQQFLQALNTERGQAPNMVQQQVISNIASFGGGGMGGFGGGGGFGGMAATAAPATPPPAENMHYQSIGRHSLAQGAALTLGTASAENDYKRFVEWKLEGDLTDWSDPGVVVPEEEVPWQVVRFENPLPFPMTTGPVWIEEGGRLQGQSMATWTASGGELSVPVTKALNFRSNAVERETGQREVVNILHHQRTKAQREGQLELTNNSGEARKVIVRRLIAGELMSTTPEAETRRLPQGNAYNPQTVLTWEFELAPEETKSLEYAYTTILGG